MTTELKTQAESNLLSAIDVDALSSASTLEGVDGESLTALAKHDVTLFKRSETTVRQRLNQFGSLEQARSFLQLWVTEIGDDKKLLATVQVRVRKAIERRSETDFPYLAKGLTLKLTHDEIKADTIAPRTSTPKPDALKKKIAALEKVQESGAASPAQTAELESLKADLEKVQQKAKADAEAKKKELDAAVASRDQEILNLQQTIEQGKEAAAQREKEYRQGLEAGRALFEENKTLKARVAELEEIKLAPERADFNAMKAGYERLVMKLRETETELAKAREALAKREVQSKRRVTK